MTPLAGFISSLLVAEGYNQYLTPEQKRKWQNRIKVHHGEAGELIAFLGALAGSKTAAAIGRGLMVHDWQDRNHWFTKRRSFS